MKIKIWELALAAALVITLIFGAAITKEQNELNEKLIRLHVVANSDSKTDQDLKLKVRDAVIEELNLILADSKNKAEAEKAIHASVGKLKNAACHTINENGFDYPASVILSKEVFPTREYETFSLPAGEYDSLRITIGEGNGKNWWCVVFPPVCAAQTFTQQDAAAVGLTDGEYKLITGESEEYVIKFRLMEIVGKFKSIF